MLNIIIKKIPEKLPKEMQKEVDKLKKCKSREECLRKAYAILTKKFTGQKFYFVTHFWEFFVTDLDVIWRRKKILNCNIANYLLRVLLVKSGHFSEKDIRNRWAIVYGISLHQYLRIKIGSKDVDVDIWGASHKIPFGRHAR